MVNIFGRYLPSSDRTRSRLWPSDTLIIRQASNGHGTLIISHLLIASDLKDHSRIWQLSTLLIPQQCLIHCLGPSGSDKNSKPPTFSNTEPFVDICLHALLHSYVYIYIYIYIYPAIICVMNVKGKTAARSKNHLSPSSWSSITSDNLCNQKLTDIIPTQVQHTKMSQRIS